MTAKSFSERSLHQRWFLILSWIVGGMFGLGFLVYTIMKYRTIFHPGFVFAWGVFLVTIFVHQFPYGILYLCTRYSPTFIAIRFIASLLLVGFTGWFFLIKLGHRMPLSFIYMFTYFYLSFAFYEAFPCMRNFIFHQFRFLRPPRLLSDIAN